MQLLSKSLKIYNIKLIDTASDNLKTVEMENDIKALIKFILCRFKQN